MKFLHFIVIEFGSASLSQLRAVKPLNHDRTLRSENNVSNQKDSIETAIDKAWVSSMT